MSNSKMITDEKVAILLSPLSESQIEDVAHYFIRKGYQGVPEVIMLQQTLRTDFEPFKILDSPVFTRSIDNSAALMRAICLAIDTLLVSETQEDAIKLILQAALGMNDDEAEDIAEDIIDESEKKQKRSMLHKEH